MTLRAHKRILFMALIAAQFCLILAILAYEFNHIMLVKMFGIISAIAAFIVLFRKFIWDIQDIDIGFDEQLIGSNFGVYAVFSYCFPVFVVSPVGTLFTGLFMPPIVTLIVAGALGLVVIVESLLFKNFVRYFSYPPEQDEKI